MFFSRINMKKIFFKLENKNLPGLEYQTHPKASEKSKDKWETLQEIYLHLKYKANRENCSVLTLVL